jgi:hypothetical protein
VRGLDERRPRVGDGRAAGFGKQSQRATFAQRFQQRRRVIRDDFDLKFPHRHAERTEKCTSAFAVLHDEVFQRLYDL